MWILLGRPKQSSRKKREYRKDKLPFEIVDTAETQKEATFLLKEYCLAYGAGWEFVLKQQGVK